MVIASHQGTHVRRRTFVVLLPLLLSAAPMAAIACGACVEDRVAATYDHVVMTQALARHHVVVFASVASGRSGISVAHEIRRTAARSKGVDASSVRVSEEPPALSFALDPTASSPETALAEIQTRLRAKNVKLTIIRVAS